MGRRPRLTYPGARHHVFNRAAGRHTMFTDDQDRKTFLALLREAHERFGVLAHAFCLMGNHYHLVLYTPNGGLSQAMHFHGSSYTRYFNGRHRRDGPLYRARFASTVVDDDAHLLELTRYVHRNPLDIRPRVRLDGYRWSSYPAYLGRGRPPGWLDVATVLELQGDDSGYRNYVEADRAGDKTSSPSAPEVRADSNSRPLPAVSELLATIDRALERSRRAVPTAHPRAAGEPDRTLRLTAVAVAAGLGVQASAIGEHLGYSRATTVRSAVRRARARAKDDPAFDAFVQQVIQATADLLD